MRVISGTARGTKLFSLEGINTRPTADRIKETIFNIIQMDIFNCNFLDLFSGSGAIGIEALSRGAKSAVFIENSKDACDIITENLDKTKLKDKAKLINGDVLTELKKINNKFDIIFLDPPYKNDLLEETLNCIVNCDLLKKDGFVISEQSLDVIEIDKLQVFKIKKYKTSKIVFYKPV